VLAKRKLEFVLAGLLLSGVAFGQKPDPFDIEVSDYRIMLSKKVMVELGITAAQKAALNKKSEAERLKVLPYVQQMQKEGKSEAMLQRDPKYIGYVREFRTQTLSVLTAPQLRRLRELSLQSVDLGGVLNESVSKRIGMSPDQLKRARTVFQKGVKQSQDIVLAVNRAVISQYNNKHVKTQAEATALNAEIEQKRQAGIKGKERELLYIQDQTNKQVLAVLTAKQLAAYRALQGKPFKAK
jgi:hypothetical protein